MLYLRIYQINTFPTIKRLFVKESRSTKQYLYTSSFEIITISYRLSDNQNKSQMLVLYLTINLL